MRTCSRKGCDNLPRKAMQGDRMRWLRTCSEECAHMIASAAGKRGGKATASDRRNSIKVGRG